MPSGKLDASAARALRLPMPVEVLEQFVIDHGLNEQFQREYAELDLHAIAWELEDLPVTQIVSCWSKFDDYVSEIAALLRKHVDDKPHPPCISPESWQSWVESGTWRRSPVFLDSVVPSRSGLHLVEGHTRVGMLTGLLDTNVSVRDFHGCWVGRESDGCEPVDWASALEEHPLSFHSWLFDEIGESRLREDIADRLIDAESALRYTRSFPSNLEGLIALATAAENCGVRPAQLVELTCEWRRELEACAGRALRLSA
jgi:hypothetical protein